MTRVHSRSSIRIHFLNARQFVSCSLFVLFCCCCFFVLDKYLFSWRFEPNVGECVEFLHLMLIFFGIFPLWILITFSLFSNAAKQESDDVISYMRIDIRYMHHIKNNLSLKSLVFKRSKFFSKRTRNRNITKKKRRDKKQSLFIKRIIWKHQNQTLLLHQLTYNILDWPIWTEFIFQLIAILPKLKTG